MERRTTTSVSAALYQYHAGGSASLIRLAIGAAARPRCVSRRKAFDKVAIGWRFPRLG